MPWFDTIELPPTTYNIYKNIKNVCCFHALRRSSKKPVKNACAAVCRKGMYIPSRSHILSSLSCKDRSWPIARENAWSSLSLAIRAKRHVDVQKYTLNLEKYIVQVKRGVRGRSVANCSQKTRRTTRMIVPWSLSKSSEYIQLIVSREAGKMSLKN